MAQGSAVKMFNVKKGVADKKDPNKKHWSAIGKVGIRDDGSGGFLRLNMLSGEFAVFPDEKKGGGGNDIAGGEGDDDYRGRQAKVRGNGYGNSR